MTKSGKDSVLLYAVGDVAVSRDDPDSIFALCASTTKQADIAFCQLETNYSERGCPSSVCRVPMRANPRNAPSIKNAGFNVISVAGNHCLDYGSEALLDTVDLIKSLGLEILGAGGNMAEAREPVIVEKKGTKVAFLAYCSILPHGYWAEEDKPGCAPMRAFTIYEQREHDQPGTPADVRTLANPGDLAAMVEDIQKVRKLADVVIVSHHFGLHFIPAQIADYQVEVAHAAIDAGADLILGHHAHILKGVEVYKGKVIPYSLCNFAFDNKPMTEKQLKSPRYQTLMKLNPSWVIDPEYPTYRFPADARKTLMLKCTITDKKIESVSFLPVYVNKQGQPEILSGKDKRSQGVVDYVNWCSQEAGLNAQLSLAGDEIMISADG
ncbi:CapA family protein [Chloroflexota bacterium]